MSDYVGAAFRKVCRIHRELPPGGILVFLTGQREVDGMCRRLRAAFSRQRARGGGRGRGAGDGAAGAAEGAEQQAGGGVRSKKRSAAEAAVAASAAANGDAAAEGDVAVAGGGGGGSEEDEEEGSLGAGDAFGADAAEAEPGFGGGGGGGAGGGLGGGVDEEELDQFEGVDDFDQMEEDEDEEEVQVLGGDEFTPEEIAAAEARFEEVYGWKLLGSCSGGGGNSSAGDTAGNNDARRGAGQQAAGSGAAALPPLHVVPLYAMLPQAQQAAAFRAPPKGHRLVVVATNVAETSITIPGIRYVVDAGRSKQKLLEAGGGLTRYEVRWVSKASAAQRAGRAGRTGPGHTYRLYSSAHFNDTFPEHTPPEILNTQLEGVVLVMKAMGVDKVSAFPFPTPPDPGLLRAATRCLCALSALEPAPAAARQTQQQQAQQEAGGRLTAMGEVMAGFPISPRHSRMVLEVVQWQRRRDEEAGEEQQQQQQQTEEEAAAAAAAARRRDGKKLRRRQRAAVQALPYALALAAALSLESPFMLVDDVGGGEGGGAGGDEAAQNQQQQEQQQREQQEQQQQDAAAKAAGRSRRAAAAAAHARLRSDGGDALGALRALCAYEAACAGGVGARGGPLAAGEVFCRDNFLQARHLKEMSALRRQLMRTLQQQQYRRPADPAAAALQLRVVAAVADAAARADGASAPLPPPPREVEDALRRAVAAGWCDQVARRVRSAAYVARVAEEEGRKRHAVRYQPCDLDEEVYLHPRSSLHAAAPEFVVYLQLVRTAKRPYMSGITPIEPAWLAACGTPLAALSPPLLEPAPFYKPEADAVLAWHDASYGRPAWPLPRAARPHPDAPARAAAFASALLAGRVLPALAALAPALVARPETAGRRELAGLPRVGELLSALERRRVDSRAALVAAWRADPSFLRPQLALWVAKPKQQLLGKLWPRLLAEAGAA